MQIKLKRDGGIPSMRAGMVFDVQAVTECRGETVYFIHHAGEYLGIPESELAGPPFERNRTGEVI